MPNSAKVSKSTSPTAYTVRHAIFEIHTKSFSGFHPRPERGRSTNISSLLLIFACASPSPPPQTEEGLSDSLQFIDLDPILQLEDGLSRFLSQDPQCPLLTYEDAQQIWHGDCENQLGYTIEGTLRTVPGAGIEGNDFSISHLDKQLFFLNGILQFTEYGSLLQVDIFGQGCGLYNFMRESSERYLLHPNDCSLGNAHFSLRASFYPFERYPEEYDFTLYGSIFQLEVPLILDGYWHRSSTCFGEPVNGILSIQQQNKHTLALNGATNCDGCALWTSQGVSLGSFCGAFP